MSKKDYDGFYFVPGEEDNEMNLSFFKFKEEMPAGKPIGGTKIGDMYYVAFFRPDDEGMPIFDESFEAIFADPTVYIHSLIGSDLAGCILRKTENSHIWWDDYLTGAKERSTMIAST